MLAGAAGLLGFACHLQPMQKLPLQILFGNLTDLSNMATEKSYENGGFHFHTGHFHWRNISRGWGGPVGPVRCNVQITAECRASHFACLTSWWF